MEEIQKLRKKIDEVDENILRLLGERSEICRSIGLLKKEADMPVVDSFREAQVFGNVRDKASDFGLDANQVEAVYRQIVNMCSSIQESKETSE
jgi:chorismate mutase